MLRNSLFRRVTLTMAVVSRLTFARRLALTLGSLLLLGFGAAAKADQVSVVGKANGSLATATVVCTFDSQTNVFFFTITNTSPHDASITGIGFDLVPGDFTDNTSSGINGFIGAPTVLTFTFSDGALGNVPQFSNAVLDFGWRTGSNFSGGDPNDGIAPGNFLVFSVVGGAFSGFTEAQICSAIFVRFQRVGANGEGSDVAVATPVPEPATMLLLGTGLAGVAAAVRRGRGRKL